MGPELADADVRRECLRANKVSGFTRLDAPARLLEYLPISTAARRQAAVVLAQAIDGLQRMGWSAVVQMPWWGPPTAEA
jgi:hypothetical protein